MNMKALAVGIVFLVVALVVPVFALYEIVTSNTRATIEILPNLSDQTAIASFFRDLDNRQNMILEIVVIVEAALVVGFAISLWYALKCQRSDVCRTFPPPA